jgi:hypothetical protein
MKRSKKIVNASVVVKPGVATPKPKWGMHVSMRIPLLWRGPGFDYPKVESITRLHTFSATLYTITVVLEHVSLRQVVCEAGFISPTSWVWGQNLSLSKIITGAEITTPRPLCADQVTSLYIGTSGLSMEHEILNNRGLLLSSSPFFQTYNPPGFIFYYSLYVLSKGRISKSIKGVVGKGQPWLASPIIEVVPPIPCSFCSFHCQYIVLTWLLH